MKPATARAAGITVGVLADALLGDPTRGHPVAGYGRAVGVLQRRLYADTRCAGVQFTGLAVAASTLLTLAAHRALAPEARPLLLAAATWVALGATSLQREGAVMADRLHADDLAGARERLGHLCARDPAGLGADELARATVESLAENTSDAAVAPLLWAAAFGAPGVIAYRAVNTLDAMVGYRSPRYLRFGWASARLDDAANLLPARVTAALTVALAPVVDGSRSAAWRAWRRDARHHPSPNAGHCEAAFAGALGVSLGGDNIYHGVTERRGTLGTGSNPVVADIVRAVRLSRAVVLAAAACAVVGTMSR